MNKKIRLIVTLVLLILPRLAAAQSSGGASGSINAGLNTAAETAGLPKVSLVVMVGIIINTLLSLLGMLFTVLILLGGFKWMTSRGNTNQVDEAKTTIRNAMIGLLIVIASYAIARFVFNSLQGITETGGGADGGG